MKLSIDTISKTITIEHATIVELESIKGAIKSIGGNPDEYSVVQLQPTLYYPTYPVPFYPYYGATSDGRFTIKESDNSENFPYVFNEGTSCFGWKTEDFDSLGTCNIDSPLN